MKNFEIGQKVIVIQNNEMRKGKIEEVYGDLGLAIVMFEDSNIEKVPISRLAIAPVEDEPKNSKPGEKSEITITPDEFKKIASDLIANESKKGGVAIIMVGSILMARLHTKLFSEADND